MKNILLITVTLLMAVPSLARSKRWQDYSFDTYSYGTFSGSSILSQLLEIPERRYGYYDNRLSLECTKTWRDSRGYVIRNPNEDLCNIEIDRMNQVQDDIRAYDTMASRRKVRRAQHVFDSVKRNLRNRQNRVRRLSCIGGGIYEMWDRSDEWFDRDNWYERGYSRSGHDNEDICEVEEESLVEVASLARAARRNLRRASQASTPPPISRPRPRGYESAYDRCIRRGGSRRQCRDRHSSEPSRPRGYESAYDRCIRLGTPRRQCQRNHGTVSPRPSITIPRQPPASGGRGSSYSKCIRQGRSAQECKRRARR